MEMVRLVNKGTEPFTDIYDNVRYTIAAGSEGFAPWEAMILWFGDPRARDADDRHKDRTDEYERLRQKYGVYHEDGKFAEVVPHIEVYSLDGQRITTVAEDPEGVPSNISIPATPTNPAETVAKLAAMEKRLNELTAAIGTLPEEQANQVVAVANGDLDPADIAAEDAAPTRPAAPVKKVAVSQDRPRTVKAATRS